MAINLIKYLLFLCTLLVYSCYSNTRNFNENTIIAHLPFKTKGLHPTNDNDAVRAQIFDLIHRSLIEVDLASGKRIPALLTKMPTVSNDGKTLTFCIRNDIKWDNGESFTVNDVLFSIKILVCPLVNNSAYKPIYNSIFQDIIPDSANPQVFYCKVNGFNRSNIDVFLDIYMLQESKWDSNHFFRMYTMPLLMNSKTKFSNELIKWAEKFNGKENSTDIKNINGLGPYQITKWEPDSYILLEKKKNWWGNKDTSLFNQNNPDKIQFTIILDEASTYFSLRNQKIDATNKITTTKLLKLQKHKYFNDAYFSAFVNQYAYTYIGLNTKPDGIVHKPFFTNKNVRKAIALLVPVDDIIKIFMKGKADRMISCVYPSKKEFNSTLQPIPYNTQKACKMLDAEGWIDSDRDNIRDKKINGERIKFSFKLNYTTNTPGLKEICLLLKDIFYQNGIEVIPNALDFGQFYQECYSQNFDAEFGAWLGSSGHEDFSQLFSTQSWSMHGENFVGFGDAYSDSLIMKINTAKSEADYLKYVHEFQQIVYDEQPYIFLVIPKNKIVIHKRFYNPGMYEEKPNFYLNAFTLNQSRSNTVKPYSE